MAELEIVQISAVFLYSLPKQMLSLDRILTTFLSITIVLKRRSSQQNESYSEGP